MPVLRIKNVLIGEGLPKIMVPIVGNSEAEILQEARYIKQLEVDIVEWRVDCFHQVEDLKAVEQILNKLRATFDKELLLFTFRSVHEGGKRQLDEAQYVALNQMAIESGKINLIDLELAQGKEIVSMMLATARAQEVFVIVSNHDLEATPCKEEIVHRLCMMQELGADIAKIAVTPINTDDVLTLLAASLTMKACATIPFITISMGKLGIVTRLVGESFGSACTFAAGMSTSAPGQIPVSELRTILRSLQT